MSAPPQPPDHVQLQKKRKRLTFVFWSSCLVLLLIGVLVWFFVLRLRAFTDDAYVEGNQLFITPLKKGFVTAIHTDDTFFVKKGQLLVELDTTDALIALDLTQKQLANQVREICQAFHQVFAYKAEIESRKAELIRTAQDYKHREDVLAAAGVSQEDFDHAVAALRSGYFALKTSEAFYERALAYVQGTSITMHPQIQAAADQLRNMWVQLYRCKVYAPVDGLVAQRSIQVGMWVNSGHPLMSIIPLDQVWVNANFKETQMKDMKIGQKVLLTSDLYGDGIVFNGTIVGLPGGAGNAFSLLPPQNLSGNWIKIVQRLPVRVQLDPNEIKKHPLRIGLSMEATVDLTDQEGGLVPTSTEVAPCYRTSIFELEEIGAMEMIEAVIHENLDPTLLTYAHTALSLKKEDVDTEIKEYLARIGVPLEEFKKTPH